MTIDLTYRDATLNDDKPIACSSVPEHTRAVEAMRVGINAISMMSPLTGIGQYTYNLVRELHAMRLEPWLFYATEWRRDVRPMVLPGMETAKSAFKRMIPKPYLVQRFFLQRLFSRGANKHQVSLYHEPSFMSYRFRGPTVVTIHDLAWLRYPETQPVDRVREMNRLMPATIKRAAHVIAVSEFAKREIIEHFGLREDQVTTTLHGVAPEFMPRNENQARAVLERYRLQFGQYLLAVGTLEPRKNLNTLLAAFAQMPQAIRQRYPLVIVGLRGWKGGLPTGDWLQMIERGEVRLTGYVPQVDLPAIYAGARLFAYPSLYEGFGMPPLEAMACGIPVIASNRASLPEVVGDAGIKTDALDDVLMSQHLRRLIEDDQLHQHLSLAGLQRARTFTWRRSAEQTVEVYSRLLSEL